MAASMATKRAEKTGPATAHDPGQTPEASALQSSTTPPRRNLWLGILCGAGASLCWGSGFVAAKHGIEIGFRPADIALHRFLWTGLLLLPFALHNGVVKFGGIGWGRGLVISLLAGAPQAMLAYTGFSLVPLGHGATIQPSVATIGGLMLASIVLGERATAMRFIGGATIVAGLVVFGFESFTTIGTHGVGGDLLFVCSGLFWAVFGTLLRVWRVPGTQATIAIGALSVLLFLPVYALIWGFDGIAQQSLFENLLQVVLQGFVAGVLPIYLYARSVTYLGAGRAATFPALVPGFTLIVGFIALGNVPTLPQLLGLAIVFIGFQLVVR